MLVLLHLLNITFFMKAILELAIIELNPQKLLNTKLICINGI